ncbi:hypothetical protein ACFLSX_01485 [Calditrichota bacterium]
MLTPKRVIVATLCGFLFGIICTMLASSNPESAITWSQQMSILFGRTLMGFVIGISAFKLSWWMHGILIGFITSIPMAIPIIDRMDIFIGTFVMGMIYGFLTELITTKLFKAKAANVG